MGYKLCMTEKPSVAADIAKVIGATQKKQGYYEGNGYLVTWAVGHLVGLAEPEAYGYVSQKDMYVDQKEKAFSELPLMPDAFKLVVIENTKPQFQVIKKLIHREDVDEIINCGDMGAEGHILQWFIRFKAGCDKPVRRFCATSMTEEAIRHAMNHLRAEEEFTNIVKGEYCKKKADWMLGMSMSRAESLKYGANISVGRVQSPTLYFIVKRYLEVLNFKVTNYYTMDASLDENFHVYWKKDTQGAFPTKCKDSENRVLDKMVIDKKIQELLIRGKGRIKEVKEERKKNDRPKLYDITELQRDANKRYGYSASVTLATAQALYETQKVLSYPRTDSRYITEDLKPYMADRIRSIGKFPKYQASADVVLKDGLNIDKKIVDDTKVTDHHALILTEKINGYDFSKLIPTAEEKKKGVTSESMQHILELVMSRMIISFSKPYRYEQTSITVEFDGAENIPFTATGKHCLDKGWKGIEEQLLGKTEKEDSEKEEEQTLPKLSQGQVVTIKDLKNVFKKTTPPKLHTEATLLTSMENAGALLKNGAILKGKGIGTQATRAEIIKTLFTRGYCKNETKGKTNYIVPTAMGLNVIQVLPKELYSPKITADWETKIAKIADGKMREEEFLQEFKMFLKQKVSEVKDAEKKVSFKKEREVKGVCPFCGSPVYSSNKKEGSHTKIMYYCSKEKDADCPFFLTNLNYTQGFTQKAMTEIQMKKLIAKGEIVLNCKKKDGSGTYKRKFILEKTEYKGKLKCNIKDGGFV